MNLKPFTFALFGALVALPAFAVEQTINLSVPSMYCASCPFIVEAAIGDVDGVMSVSADSDERTALVVYDDDIATLEDILDATLFAGYEAFVIDAKS